MPELKIEDLNFSDTVEKLEPIEPTIDPIKPDPKPEPVPEPKVPEPKPVKGKKKEEVKPVVEPVPDPVVEPIVEPEPEPESDDVPLINEIAKELGYEFQEGEEYADDTEGLLAFVQSASDKMSDEKLNGWLGSLPPVASEFFDYITMLGEEATEDKVKAFFTAVNPEVDYKSIDLKSEDVQKAVMKTMYRDMGWTEEEITDGINDLEVGGLLAKQSKIAAAKLAANQEKSRTELLAKERLATKEREDKAKQYWGTIKETIDSGKIGNFQIPATEKKATYDYMASKQFDKDLNAYLADPNTRIELALAIKNKFKLDKYVAQAATTQRANGLKNQLKGNTGKMKSGDDRSLETSISIDYTGNVGA